MFVSARFIKMEDLTNGGFTTDQYTKALDDRGQEWTQHKDSQAGDWQAYLASGGTIAPYQPEIAESIISAPDGLFGGPALKDVFHGNG